MASRPASRNWLPEVALYSAACLSLLVSCIIWSSKKQQWVDEVYTRTQASDPSFKHMLHALWLIGPGSIPLFYMTVWAWAQVFGYGDLSLRLYSSVGMCAAMLVLAVTLRRCWPTYAVALGVLTVWCGSAFIGTQNVDGRCYGLYVLAAALAVAAYLRVAPPASPTKSALFLAGISQAVLVLTHLIGLIYGFLMLLALVLFDATQRRFRPLVYLCHASGWLVLLCWIPSIRTAIEANRPHTWIPLPTLLDLLLTYTFGLFGELLVFLSRRSPGLAGGMSVVVFVCILSLLAVGFKDLLHRQCNGRQALLILGFLFLSAPLFLFAISYVTTPLYVLRYLLPTCIGLAIVLTSVISRHLKSGTILPLICIALVALPVLSAIAAPHTGFDVSRVDAAANSGLPIVAAYQHDFFVLLRYSNSPQRYVYLLDWETALHGRTTSVTDFHLMRDYRSQGYYVTNILDQAGFLCSHAGFFVLDDTESTWFDQTISSSPDFSWNTVAQIDPTRRLIHVERKYALPHCGV